MNPNPRPAVLVLALSVLAACAHVDSPPASADAVVVDPALLRQVGAKNNEYVLRYEHNDGLYGYRDKFILATFPVKERNGLCTTSVRTVGILVDASRPPPKPAPGRVVFREAASGGCAARSSGDFYYSDEASLPSLLAAQQFVAANGFGEAKPMRGCLGRLPESYSPALAKLSMVSAAPGGLRMEFNRPEDPTWSVILMLRMTEAGPVRESATVSCLDL